MYSISLINLATGDTEVFEADAQGEIALPPGTYRPLETITLPEGITFVETSNV